MAVTLVLTGGRVEQGLLAGGEAVLLVSVEQGLMRCVPAEVWKRASSSFLIQRAMRETSSKWHLATA